jgi:hypothetical protein
MKTLRALYRSMHTRDLRALREAFRLDAAERPGDRRVQAFTAYRIRLITQVLRER